LKKGGDQVHRSREKAGFPPIQKKKKKGTKRSKVGRERIMSISALEKGKKGRLIQKKKENVSKPSK